MNHLELMHLAEHAGDSESRSASHSWHFFMNPYEMLRVERARFAGAGGDQGSYTMSQNNSAPFTVFTEAEYRADPQSVVAHAVATGRAIVARPDGTVRVVISIPPAERSVAKP